jgi:hypothetical protein
MKVLVALILLLVSCQMPSRQANAAEVPAQYRGLWCEPREGINYSGNTYYRCRKATSEGYQQIWRDRIKLDEENNCRVIGVRPTAKGHRLSVDCPSTGTSFPNPPKHFDLRLNTRGRLTVRDR